MSALTAIRRVIQSKAAVTALVGSRVYPIQAVQADGFPALVLTLASEDDSTRLEGADFYPVAHIIVDCLAKTFGEAETLGDKLKNAIIDYRGTVTGYGVNYILASGLESWDKGEAGDVFRFRIGFRMRYRTA